MSGEITMQRIRMRMYKKRDERTLDGLILNSDDCTK